MKLSSKEVHIDNLMKGALYMNAAGYYHGLTGKWGDPLEASLAYGIDIYANWLLPIYRMFIVRESDIVNNTVPITCGCPMGSGVSTPGLASCGMTALSGC